MIQILYILLGMVIVLFALSILFAVLPDKKKKEEKPKDKIEYSHVVLQFKLEDGCIYTLYNDFTWDVDTEY